MRKIIIFSGIPTDEEQATGLEKIIMTAKKEGTVRWFVICSLSTFTSCILILQITQKIIILRADAVASGFTIPHMLFNHVGFH